MTYVLSDIHGNLQRFKSIMAQINLQTNDTLYVLGDVIDRYAGGIKILRQIMRMPNAKMLIGNHEYMMLNAIGHCKDAAEEKENTNWREKRLWYCQTAFDNYAKGIGDEVCDERGLKTHGNGYEWDAAFREAFADEPNIERIIFDSEAGGFFCNCDDLQILTDFGSRFKNICENTELFTKTIAEGIKNADEREAEQERIAKTVRGQLMRHPECSFGIMTADGRVQLTPEDIKAMLGGEKQDIRIDGVIYAAYELLDMEVVDMQADLFDNGLIRIKADESEEQAFEQTM